MRIILWIAGLSLACASCAAGGSDSPEIGPADGTGGSATGIGGQSGGLPDAAAGASGSPGDAAPVIDVNTSGDGTASGNCASGASLIYVLAKSNELHRFDPQTLQLSKVGALQCPQNGGTATPFSMAVDRQAMAWVLFNDGHLYKVDTKTAACSATTFVPDQSGFKKFGMGFVSDSPGSQAETLYVANELGIGTIDTVALTVKDVAGDFGFSAAAELTGTGDARLFGFFYGFPPYISEIDKSSSKLLGEMELDTVDIGTGFAYAFWGGDFWIFTAPNGVSSQIDRYKPTAGNTTTEVVVADVGFKIVGAGVSTCAPLAAPK